MNYSKIYFNIIENRKNNPYHGYVEKHHIIPKSLGGTDAKTNLVELSAREHFICHLLLTKIHENDIINYRKMLKAFMMMLFCKSNNQERFSTSRKYEFLRIKFSQTQSTLQKGENNSQYGKIKSTELRNKIKQSVIKTLELKGIKCNSKELKNRKKTEKEFFRKKEVDIHREYYIIYKEFGFNKFVELTGYTKSKQNLVQRFKKLLPEFIPQNGKKRGQ